MAVFDRHAHTGRTDLYLLVMEHFARSEEHTSELQSPDHLVCRLLLEKKNNTAEREYPDQLDSFILPAEARAPASLLDATPRLGLRTARRSAAVHVTHAREHLALRVAL